VGFGLFLVGLGEGGGGGGVQFKIVARATSIKAKLRGSSGGGTGASRKPQASSLTDASHDDMGSGHETRVYLGFMASKPLGKTIICVLFFVVLGRFSANGGPRTSANGLSSESGAERPKN
jgi:hypothetical protein